jgi:glutamate-ammonia-ligase adenylyltransferase
MVAGPKGGATDGAPGGASQPARITRALAAAIERSADAASVRTFVDRLVETDPGARAVLEENETARDGVVALAGASRSLSSALVSDPSLLDCLLDRESLARERVDAGMRAAWDAHREARGGGAGELRRWKRGELLRVAARDLLGLADLPAVGRELAALAGVCLEAAVAVVDPPEPFAVVAMGKLGGRELNYASDVDVLFVHDGDLENALQSARGVLAAMGLPGELGIVFRTDADLRPEGAAGPLSRTLGSYLAWYDEWARPWEFQALIKARPVAGDAALGARFVEATRSFVWRDRLDADTVREIRVMKARAEAELSARGLTDRELKRGRGGIRDIEFAVQLLQLVHGRHDDSVRSPTTLDALAALASGGYVETGDTQRLDQAYRFLRTVEHRLQLQDEQQTHTIPHDRAARTRLARVLGYRDQPWRSALEGFDADASEQQRAVRSIHERLFFAPLLDALAGVGPLAPDAAADRLSAFGFTDMERTRAAVEELATGLSRRSRLMQELLPVVLGWLSETPDPDLGLLQLRRLAEGATRSASLATTLRDAPVAAQRACVLLGSSRVVGDALRRQPEFVDQLDDAEALAEKSRDDLVDDARDTLEWRGDDEQRREGLRRFKRRELLRIATRDVLGLASLEATGRELGALAEACLEGALDSLRPSLPFTVIGLGRLGGGELSYASDIDVMFVYDGDGSDVFEQAEQLALRLVQEIGATTAEGQTFRVDARLRPEGADGPLARSVESCAVYYEQWARTWERQALTQARVVAGDAALGARFLAVATDTAYGRPFTEDDAREVRRAKARIERERIPPGEDPQFHLKLGRGSLSDVEFTVQLLQLLHGTRPAVRVRGTLAALHVLESERLVASDDAAALSASYRFCERTRNALHLLDGRPSDSLPVDAHDLERLGRRLGYLHRPEVELRDDYRRHTRRARRTVEHLFYGTR